MDSCRRIITNPENSLTGAGCFLYLLLILAPLVVLLLQSTDAGWELFAQTAFPRGRQMGLLLNSLCLSAVVAIAGTFLATTTALWLYTRPQRLAGMIKWLFLLMLLVPSYIHTMAWGTAFHTMNMIFLAHNVPIPDLGGWTACGWVEIMHLLPVGVGLVLLGLSSLDSRCVEAGMIWQPPCLVWRKIVIPMLYPVMSLSAALLFLLTFIDYSIPSLFQVSTYALEIFAEFSYSNDPGRVIATAVPLLLVSGLVLVLNQNTIRQAVMQPGRKHAESSGLLIWPRKIKWMQGLAVTILLLQMGVPVAVIIGQIGEVQVFLASVMSSSQEIWLSLKVAALTALFSIIPALAVATRILQRPERGSWLIGLSTMPLALPASLTGIGLIALLNHPFADVVYSSVIMMVLAPLIRFMPLAVLILTAFLARINPHYFEAASVLQRKPGQAFTKVLIPLALPGMIAAGVLVFAFTAGELGATLMVAPPGMATLTMKIYNYLHYGATGTVASLCLAMLIFTAVLILLAMVMVNKFFHRTISFQEGAER